MWHKYTKFLVYYDKSVYIDSSRNAKTLIHIKYLL